MEVKTESDDEEVDMLNVTETKGELIDQQIDELEQEEEVETADSEHDNDSVHSVEPVKEEEEDEEEVVVFAEANDDDKEVSDSDIGDNVEDLDLENMTAEQLRKVDLRKWIQRTQLQLRKEEEERAAMNETLEQMLEQNKQTQNVIERLKKQRQRQSRELAQSVTAQTGTAYHANGFQPMNRDDFNVCWEYNTAAGCQNGSNCRWTHQTLSTRTRHPYTGQEINGRTVRSKRRERKSRERQSDARKGSIPQKPTSATKYKQRREDSQHSRNRPRDDKEDLFSKMQQKVLEDNKRLKMGSNYGSNPVYESPMANGTASSTKELGQRPKRQKPRRAPRSRSTQSSNISQNAMVPQIMSPRNGISNGYRQQQAATLAAAAGRPPSNGMHRPLVQNPSVPNLPSVPMPAVPPSSSISNLLSSVSRVPSMLPNAYRAPSATPASSSYTPPRKSYEAHTPYRRVADGEPTGYYGTNLGWGTSPKKRRKYILVQKNTNIY